MIWRMAGGPQLREVTPAALGGRPNGLEEFGFADVGAARSGEQQALWSESGQGGGDQSSVGLYGTVPFEFTFRQRRRVEDDDIEIAPWSPGEPGEAVGLNLFVTGRSHGGQALV